jgi:hypothetical protein
MTFALSALTGLGGVGCIAQASAADDMTGEALDDDVIALSDESAMFDESIGETSQALDGWGDWGCGAPPCLPAYPAPYPEPVPVPVAEPVPVPVAAPVPVPVAVPIPVPPPCIIPVPIPVPAPYPIPIAVPVPVAVPVPIPAPIYVAVPTPFPVPVLAPYPVAVPVPVAVPAPCGPGPYFGGC